MGASISNSFNPDFSNIQTPVENSQKNTATPTSGSATITYGFLQGPQTTTGQNINATLGGALGAMQNSIANSSLPANNNSTQETNIGDAPVANSGLSTDQQVIAQQGAKGHGSQNNSRGQSGESQDVYIGSAASGLQKGQGSQSSVSISSINSSANFTLKVDTSEPISSTNSASSTTSYVDSNGAPSLPPAPNVFGMIAEAGELSSNLQLNTVSDMVAASNGMNNNLAKKYSTEISDIQKYVAAKNNANNESGLAQAFGWVVNIAMVVVGCLTADPILIGAGIAGCIMTADPKIVNQLAGGLQQMFPGMQQQVADIMATLVIIAAACVTTAGVGAAAELGTDVTTVAARAAIDAAEDSAEDGTADMLSEGLEDEVKGSTEDAVAEENQAEELNESGEQIASDETDADPAEDAVAEENQAEELNESGEQIASDETDADPAEDAVTEENQAEELNESGEQIASNAADADPAEDAVAEENQTEELNDSGEQITSDETDADAKAKAFSKKGSWSDWAKDATRFKNAMNTPEGRAAFEASIKEQMASGASSIWKNISEMSVSAMVDTAIDSMSNGAKSLSNGAKSVGDSMYNAGASLMKAAEDPLEAMNTQLTAISKVMAKFASDSSTEDDAIVESATSAKGASMFEKTKQSAESLYANLTSMAPKKMIQLSAELALVPLSVTASAIQYDASQLKKISMDDQASLLEAKAATTDINQQIGLSNYQINEVISSMNASIAAAGNTLSNYSSLSSETLGQLHGAAA